MILAALLLAAAPPADAGAGAARPVEHLKKVVVDAIRNCPVGKPGEIVVCSRDRGMAEGYRLPRLDPRFAQASPRAGSGVAGLNGVDRSGTGSCSASGGGGFTGCAQRDYDAWGDWKKGEKAEGRPFAW